MGPPASTVVGDGRSSSDLRPHHVAGPSWLGMVMNRGHIAGRRLCHAPLMSARPFAVAIRLDADRRLKTPSSCCAVDGTANKSSDAHLYEEYPYSCAEQAD